MKSLRSTLLLFVVVAALGGYIWFNERGPIAQIGATVLLRNDPNTVRGLAMQWHGAPVVLRKNGSLWMKKMNQSPQTLKISSKRHQKMEFDDVEKIKPPFIEAPL